MCHESTGTALTETIGIGKSTVVLRRLLQGRPRSSSSARTPATNHPRMLIGPRGVQAQRRPDHRGEPAARGGTHPLQEPAEAARHPREGHGDRRPVPADPLGGDMALLPAVVEEACSRPRTPRPAPCSTTSFLDGHTHGVEAFREHVRDRRRGRRCSTATGLDPRRDREAFAERLPRRRPGDHHLGDGPHPAEEGRRDHQARSSTSCCCAATSASPARGRLPDPRAHQRAGRPHDGHLREDARAAFLDALEAEFGFAAAAQARHGCPAGRRGARSAARSRSSSPWAATSSAPSPDTARRGGGDARARASTVQVVDEAQPLARRHRRRGAHPADPRPHRGRPAGRAARSSSRSRTACAPCTPRTAGVPPVGDGPAVRGGDRRPAGPGHPGRPGRASTGRAWRRDYDLIRDRIAPRRARLRVVQRRTSAARAASSCRTARATSADSTPPPARR